MIICKKTKVTTLLFSKALWHTIIMCCVQITGCRLFRYCSSAGCKLCCSSSTSGQAATSLSALWMSWCSSASHCTQILSPTLQHQTIICQLFLEYAAFCVHLPVLDRCQDWSGFISCHLCRSCRLVTYISRAVIWESADRLKMRVNYIRFVLVDGVKHQHADVN